ncbi:hypothetical protein AB733_23025 [Photobacterium swingsii]|uniref:Lipoprotein n=1 Tax=Photobacterium swingsii TaxID=680026 RepID=A0A0J8V5F2_9GAMM|nr:hypothetical protein [Photobacterium swingsii]KMV28551.1 hypothetical protein AB733_23025 [Photobacterium swingsii]PSW24521.1 hypothetical protein C9I94_10825 [Photobacterium swingsii]
MKKLIGLFLAMVVFSGCSTIPEGAPKCTVQIRLDTPVFWCGENCVPVIEAPLVKTYKRFDKTLYRVRSLNVHGLLSESDIVTILPEKEICTKAYM